MPVINTAKPSSLMAAMRHFFGSKEDQTLTQFAAEVFSLSDDERSFFRKGLEANGYPPTTGA